MFIRKTLIVAVALALPATAAFAQSADTAYCQALSAKYRDINRGASPSGAAADAMASCTANPAAGIPVLEKSLTDAKMPLPPRPMAFNPKAYPTVADCMTAAYAAKVPLAQCGK
jgi:hypothetical protein